jgi:hypothetical protein
VRCLSNENYTMALEGPYAYSRRETFILTFPIRLTLKLELTFCAETKEQLPRTMRLSSEDRSYT